MSITANIEARARFTEVLQPVKMHQATADEAAALLFGIAYKQPGMVTKEECVEIFGRVFDERGKMEADAVLSRHGIWAIRDIPPMLYERFWTYCQAVLVYGACPFYGWEINNISPQVRDRWLLWHAESDCLWEVRGKLSNELDDGQVADVTGIPEHEQRFMSEGRRFLDPLPPKEEEL